MELHPENLKFLRMLSTPTFSEEKVLDITNNPEEHLISDSSKNDTRDDIWKACTTQEMHGEKKKKKGGEEGTGVCCSEASHTPSFLRLPKIS